MAVNPDGVRETPSGLYAKERFLSMNICLIRPSKLIVLNTLIPKPTPPLGMAYIAGALKEAGHHVTVLDCMVEAPEQVNEFDIPYNSSKLPDGYKIATLGLSPDE